MSAHKTTATIHPLSEKSLEALKRRLAEAEAKYDSLSDEELEGAENALQARVAQVASQRRGWQPGTAVRSWRRQLPLVGGLVAACLLGVLVWPTLRDSTREDDLAGSTKGTGETAACTFELNDGSGHTLVPPQVMLHAGQTYLIMGRCLQNGFLQIKVSSIPEGGEASTQEFRNAAMKSTATHRPLTDGAGAVMGFVVPSGSGKMQLTWSLTQAELPADAPLSATESGRTSGSFEIPFAGGR